MLGDPVLRKKAKEVSQIDEHVLSLIKDMFEVMYANDGVGLAAPQLGVPLRIIVVDDGKPRAMINPQIVYRSEEKVVGEEGCLSVPEIFENVERSKEVILKYKDENGIDQEEKFVDYSARIVQHEYDHLDGVLFIDLIPAERRVAIREKLLDIVKRSAHQR